MSSLQSDYERIIRPIEQQMMRSVWRITQDADAADDAFQEATIQIWQRLQRIRAHNTPRRLEVKKGMIHGGHYRAPLAPAW